jgi:hypothetical protein
MTLDYWGQKRNASKKRFRDDENELQPEKDSHQGPTTFKKTHAKPLSLRQRNREQLLSSVMGVVTDEAKRKRSFKEPTVEAKKRREDEDEDDEEMEAERRKYPDDQALLDICFGGRARNSGIKRSTLLITITTNKTAFAIHNQTDLDQFKTNLTVLVKGILQDKDSWKPKVNTEEWGTIEVDFSKPQGNRIIDGTKIRAEVKELAWEEGVKYKRVHLHIMASLSYQNFNGYFHINKRALWEQIRYLVPGITWGERLPYINLRFIKNAVDSVAEYINKLHNQDEYETLAKRTLDRINEYQQTI